MSENKTATDPSAIRAQLAGITPGEWTTKPFGPSDHVDDGLWITTEDDREVIVDMTTERGEDWEDQTRANIAFIAAAPSTVTRLLGIVEAVEALHTFAHTDVEPWAMGYRFSGDHCAYDGETWPCATIQAIAGEGGA